MENYLEFLATRKTKEKGLELITDENAAESTQYTKFKREAMKILNRFPYDTYEQPVGFLFYVESLKRFVVVRAEKGEKVDQRLNMRLTLRIPMELSRREDGFDFCLCQLWQWECKDSLPEWCENTAGMGKFSASFGFDQEHLEFFLAKWLRSICAQQGEPIKVINSSREGMRKETAVWTAALAYQFLPKGRENKYSFACFGRPEKCRGFRIQATDFPTTGTVLDLGEPAVPAGNHMDAPMIREAARQFLEGKEQYQLPVQIDWYFAKAGDYNSLVWNFYYYMMDRNRQLQLSPDIFHELQEGLEKLQRSGLPQVERLYDWLLTQSMEQPEQSGQEELLQVYMDLMNRKEAYTEEQTAKLWQMLESYAQGQGGKNTFRDFMMQIRESSSRLYYALVSYGISAGKLSADENELDDLLQLPDFGNTDEAMAWIEQQDHQMLLKEQPVQDALMRKISRRMTKDQPPEKIQELVHCAEKINKKQCLYLIRRYLEEGTEPLLKEPDLCAWKDYLLQRQKLWRLSPALLGMISEQYEDALMRIRIPMKAKQMGALTGMGMLLCRMEQEKRKRIDFDMCSRAVRTGYHSLLKRYGEKENSLDGAEEKEAFLENLKCLLEWNPDGKKDSPEVHNAQKIYENMSRLSSRQRIRNRSLSELLGYQIWKETPNAREEYRVWLQTVAEKVSSVSQVEEILIQLDKRQKDIRQYCSMEDVYQVLYRLIRLCRGHEKIYWRVRTAAAAQKFSTTPEFYDFCGGFWDGIAIPDFPEIFNSEKDAGGFSAVVNAGSGLMCRLYRIYREFRREGAGDQTARVIYEMREKLSEQMATEFFQELFKSCPQREHKKNEKFGEIRDLMFAYWDDEENVVQCVEKMHFSDNPQYDERMKNQIINQFESVCDEQEKKRRERYLPADLICGFQLGGILGMISCLWSMLEPFDLAPFAVAIVVLLLAGIAIVAHTLRTYMDEPRTVTYPAFLFSLGVWIFQLFLLKLTADIRLPAMMIGVLFTALGTGGLILQNKRGKRNG